MTKELVSIIIRTKNEEKWINHCLNSILKQESRIKRSRKSRNQESRVKSQ